MPLGDATWERRAIEILSQLKSFGDTVNYYQTDSHDDVSKWGTVAYSYDAFGNETSETTGINPFRYNGEYFDEESGLIYLRNRYYNPANGCFTTEDPIQDGTNWYTYCANNPVMFVDPRGLTPKDAFKTLDEAAKDAGDYFLNETYKINEEKCAVFYYDSKGNIKYREVLNTYKQKELGFRVSWQGNVIAFLHTHVFYDVDNLNEDFSTSITTTGPGDDISFAQRNNIPIYVATPTGKLKQYDPSTQTETLVSEQLVKDHSFMQYEKLKNTLAWNLIVNNYPKIDKMDIVEAYEKDGSTYSVLKSLNIIEENKER